LLASEAVHDRGVELGVSMPPAPIPHES
jgi:hypothetical protein